jgi:hypothetical protein
MKRTEMSFVLATPACHPRESGDPERTALRFTHWVLPRLNRGIIVGMTMLLVCASANAQTVAGDTFADGKDGAKVHTASGFVCPAKIGLFERDAVGESSPETGRDFCAYGALDGVYGTIKLTPLHGAYNAEQSMAGEFAEQEGTVGKRIAQKDVRVASAPNAPPLVVFTRTYEAAKLEDLHYRVEFAGAAVNNWAVEASIEFAEPRDTPLAQDFFRAVYAAAQTEISTAH